MNGQIDFKISPAFNKPIVQNVSNYSTNNAGIVQPTTTYNSTSVFLY